jgi:hypothetical protein
MVHGYSCSPVKVAAGTSEVKPVIGGELFVRVYSSYGDELYAEGMWSIFDNLELMIDGEACGER